MVYFSRSALLVYFTWFTTVNIQQITANPASCYQGFMEKLPDQSEYAVYSILNPRSYDRPTTYLFPRLMFTCDGMLEEVTIPWYAGYLEGDKFWSVTATVSLSLWRKNGSDYIQVKTFKLVHRLVDEVEPNVNAFYTKHKGIYTVKFNESVYTERNTFIGFTLPGSKTMTANYMHFKSTTSYPYAIVSQHMPILQSSKRTRMSCKTPVEGETINNCLLPQNSVPDPMMQIKFKPLSGIGEYSKGPMDISASSQSMTDSVVTTSVLGVLIALLVLVIAGMLIIIILMSIKIRHKHKCSTSNSSGNEYIAYYNSRVNHASVPMVAFDEADSTTVDRPSPSVNPAYEVIGEENLTANGGRTENLRVPYSHLVSESTSSLQLRSTVDSTYSSLPQDRQYQNSSFENGHECKGYSFVPNSTQRQKAATSGTPAAEPAYEFVIPPNINPTNEQTDEDSNAYWNPGHTAMEIYDQMSSKKFIEIPRSAIEEQDKMGEGEFGIVYKGQWKLPNEKSLPVAVKTLKSTASNDERIKLLQEAVIMGQFRHPHILKLHGVVSLSEPVSMILEYMSKGDLRNHLIALRKRTAKGERSHLKQLEGELLTFCQEIADGMRYLSGKSFVHRDLATRNILLTSDNHCKIGDFGLTKELSEEYYYKPRGGQIPVKWTAPEAIFYKKYTTKSDVWSYGMVMYEIWSLGRKPFDDWQIQEIVDVLETGYCLPPPPGCPRQAYQLMVTCWNRKFHQRPTFDELHHSLVALTTHTHELDVPVPNGASALSGILGAPLKHGHKLYIDLQETYKE